MFSIPLTQGLGFLRGEWRLILESLGFRFLLGGDRGGPQLLDLSTIASSAVSLSSSLFHRPFGLPGAQGLPSYAEACNVFASLAKTFHLTDRLLGPVAAWHCDRARWRHKSRPPLY